MPTLRGAAGASCRRCRRALALRGRCAPRRAAGRLLSDGLRIGYRHGFDSGPFMAHVYANRAVGPHAARARDRPPAAATARTCVAFRDIRALAEAAVLEAIDAAGEAGRPSSPTSPPARRRTCCTR